MFYTKFLFSNAPHRPAYSQPNINKIGSFGISIFSAQQLRKTSFKWLEITLAVFLTVFQYLSDPLLLSNVIIFPASLGLPLGYA